MRVWVREQSRQVVLGTVGNVGQRSLWTAETGLRSAQCEMPLPHTQSRALGNCLWAHAGFGSHIQFDFPSISLDLYALPLSSETQQSGCRFDDSL